jgi:hypothetical protein
MRAPIPSGVREGENNASGSWPAISATPTRERRKRGVRADDAEFRIRHQDCIASGLEHA